MPSRPPLGPGCDNSARTDSRGQALANGSAVVFDGASDPPRTARPGLPPRVLPAHRPRPLSPGQRYHTHDRIEPAQPSRIYRVDIELWPHLAALATAYRRPVRARPAAVFSPPCA